MNNNSLPLEGICVAIEMAVDAGILEFVDVLNVWDVWNRILSVRNHDGIEFVHLQTAQVIRDSRLYWSLRLFSRRTSPRRSTSHCSSQ